MRRTLVIGAIAAAAIAIAAALAGVLLLPQLNLAITITLFAVALLAVIAAILFVVFATVFPLFGPEPARPAEVAAAEQAGRRSFARVVSAQPTGAQINGRWVYDTVLVVAQSDMRAFRTSRRIRLHRREGILRGGEIVSVVRVHRDVPELEIVAGPRGTPQNADVPADAPEWTGGAD